MIITAASVAAGSGAAIDRTGNAGATITAGQLVYKDSSNLWQLSDANLSAASKTIGGVSLHASLNGQPLSVLTSGPITIGATMAVGAIYGLSATAGGIAVLGNVGGADGISDLVSGMTTCIFGVATSATVIQVNIVNSGAAVP